MIDWLSEHWSEFVRSILGSFAAIFIPIEAFEVLDIGDLSLGPLGFAAILLLPGLAVFFINGYFIKGYLKSEVEIPNSVNDTLIKVKFGDLFAETGWKAISVNDFFDNKVDDDLVSSRSLHGMVLQRFWNQNVGDWAGQISKKLKQTKFVTEQRPKGNKKRYPIGTTARASIAGENFLFVALGSTDISNNETSANAEMLISAVRGLASEARSACSMEPLTIPLLGSGLARVRTSPSNILDLIITGLLEESQEGRVTGEIVIVLPERLKNQINLKNSARNWINGK